MKRALPLLLLLALSVPSISRSQIKPLPANKTKARPGENTAQAVHLNNLGAAYMNQQKFARALGLFRRSLALDPKLEAAEVNVGIALGYLQKYDRATTTLKTATARHPDSAHAWYALGLVHKNQGDWERSLAAFQSAAKIAPDDADVFYFLGLVQSEQGQYQNAATAFQHALELNPFHASAEFGLARALQRSGQTEKAREHLARFQHLTESKMGIPMSLNYGDQGRLSLAMQVVGEMQPSLTTTSVRFLDTTAASGLKFSATASDVAAETDQAGSGACFLDFDDDGRPDLFVANGGPRGGMVLFHNAGQGKFEDVTDKAGLDAKLHVIACAAGDYDNDGHTDLAVTTGERVLLFHNEGNGTFKDVTDSTSISGKGPFLGITFVDYDHDGDLDLFVTSKEAGKNVVWRNNGNGKFTDVTSQLGFPGDTAAFGVTSTDFNNDRAVDLIFAAAQPQLFLNPREGHWRPVPLWSQAALSPVTSVIAFDFNKDGWMDLAFAHDGAPGVTLWRNRGGKNVEQVQLPLSHWRRAWGIAALDYDNDGWMDLAAVGETDDGKGEIRLFRNLGANGFKDVTAEVGLEAIKLTSPRALVATDVYGDGAADLLVTQLHAPAMLLRNTASHRNNFLRLSLKGLADNKSAVGTKVEVFAGKLWQKWEISGSGYLSQSATDLVAGLGKERQADIVRASWPSGVVQDEPQVAANSSLKVSEIDRRGSSCPVLFAWDGRKFRFVSDMLGAGVVGHWVGPGLRNIPDSTEYIKVGGENLQLRHGLLQFRLMEPLEEVVYLDQVRLLAIAHPPDVDVYPNEYFAGNPPFPEFKVITSRHAQLLAGAWDGAGHNVLDLLRSRDRRYVTGFELLPYKGFTRSHTLELELPGVYQGGPLRLLFHGYIEYFTANSMYAAWQAGIDPVAPYMEVLDSGGKWVRVLDDMGFPAGLPRAMVVDLTGKIPQDAQRLRITTNLQIYWDQILVDTSVEESKQIQISNVPLVGARLSFHGYPRLQEHSFPGDFEFNYEEASPTGPYARPVGAYTRFGDVRDLLFKSDDRFVVFGSGDEVQLSFDPSRLPQLPHGWKRDYFFFADGYEKDMDFYAADGGSFVNPLPFHAMRQYPYSGESYPESDGRLNDLLNYDTRFFSGAPAASYRFQYPRRKPTSKH